MVTNHGGDVRAGQRAPFIERRRKRHEPRPVCSDDSRRPRQEIVQHHHLLRRRALRNLNVSARTRDVV